MEYCSCVRLFSCGFLLADFVSFLKNVQTHYDNDYFIISKQNSQEIGKGSELVKKRGAKFKICTLPLFMMVAWILSGCGAKANGEITKIIFNRGHGSIWGNQFYIELSPEEIVTARYISEDTLDLVTAEHIPITESQWQNIKNTVEQFPLKKAKKNIWEKQKLDGGEFRELTLERGGKKIAYLWSDTEEARQLELLLETLLADSIEPNTFCP